MPLTVASFDRVVSCVRPSARRQVATGRLPVVQRNRPVHCKGPLALCRAPSAGCTLCRGSAFDAQ